MELNKDYLDLLIGLAAVLFLVFQGILVLRWIRSKQNEKLDVTQWLDESEEVTPLGAGHEGVGIHEGVEYSYIYTPASQYVTPSFRIMLSAMSTGSFEIRGETRTDRLFKKFGVTAEIQTHDPDFDHDFYIHSGTPEFTSSFLMHTKRRHLIRKILDTGFTSVRHDGKVMEAAWQPFTVTEELGKNTIAATAGHLIEISKNMPDVSQMATLEPRASRGVKRGAVFAIPIIMLVTGYLLLFFGSGRYPPLDLREIVVDSLKYSLPALLGFIWLAVMWLRGGSSSHKELLIVTLIALAAFPLFGASMEITLNGALDESKPAQHTARVVKKSAVRSQTGIKHYAIVKSWRKNRKTEKITVTSDFYRALRRGRTTVKLQTKKGWRGFEWLVSYEIAKRRSREGA